jgi:hypothetical protein
MIGFARLSGKVWRAANTFTSPGSIFTTDNIEYFDYQVLQWQKRIPETLIYEISNSEALAASNKEPVFARAITYARINQLRSLIYRPILYSSSRIIQNKMHAQTAADIAKNTISFFEDLSHATGVYEAHPTVFNHFLVSALGVLLLAIANAPDHFDHQCRDAYYTALRMMKQSAMESQVSMRLWRTVENLEGLGPILGIAQPLLPLETHFEETNNANKPDQLTSRNTLVDLNQHAAPQFPTSGLRDDLASLFGFTTDVVDHALFLPPDYCAINSYDAQLGDIFDTAEPR